MSTYNIYLLLSIQDTKTLVNLPEGHTLKQPPQMGPKSITDTKFSEGRTRSHGDQLDKEVVLQYKIRTDQGSSSFLVGPSQCLP